MSYLRKNFTSSFLIVAGIICAAFAVWQFYLFAVFRDARGAFDVQGGGFNLWLAIGAACVACACAFFGIFRSINKTEEFHITS